MVISATHVLYPQKISRASSLSDLVDITVPIIKESNPVLATTMGVILYNNLWPDISTHGVDRDIRTWKAIQTKLNEISIQPDEEDDFALLKWFVTMNLFELEELRYWESAHLLSSLVFRGISTLVSKSVPDQTSRVESIIARLRSIAPLIKGEQRRLISPVKLWVDAEIQSLNGVIRYIRTLSGMFSDESKELVDELDQTANFCISELAKHMQWLEKLEGGDLPINPEMYEKLLELRKIGYSSAELEQLGWHYLEWTELELEKLCDALDGEDIQSLRQEIRGDHENDFDAVLQSYKVLADRAKNFLVGNDLITLPEEKLIVKFTPEPLRNALSIAAAGMPGRFDKDQTGYFYCTPHDDDAMLEEHSYAYQPLLISHESYPGHHLHGACQNQYPSLIRSSLYSSSSANTGLMYSSQLADITEGWGLYSEEMMWRQGFENDPADPDLRQRFLQVNAMRWRAARIVIDTQLHSGRMSYDEAVEFLIEKTGYHRKTVEAELLMYSRSPGYFSSYLLGKHQLTDLYKKVQPYLSLKEFHDTIVYAGKVPLWYIKQLILAKAE